MSLVEHRRVGRGKCSCGEEAPLGTDIHRWWDVHLLGERPEGCRSVHCLGIECMNECESSHRLAMFAARCAAAEGVPVDSVPLARPVLVARCDNVSEPDGRPCPGEVRFHWGAISAACGTCQGITGISVARWDRVER